MRAIPYTDPELLHPEDLIWPPGVGNFRIQYAAGYTTIPESIQEACASWTEHLYYAYQRNPSIVTTASAPAGGTATSVTYMGLSTPPNHVRGLLDAFRRHSV